MSGHLVEVAVGFAVVVVGFFVVVVAFLVPTSEGKRVSNVSDNKSTA